MLVDVRIRGRTNGLNEAYVHIRLNVTLLGEERWRNACTDAQTDEKSERRMDVGIHEYMRKFEWRDLKLHVEMRIARALD